MSDIQNRRPIITVDSLLNLYNNFTYIQISPVSPHVLYIFMNILFAYFIIRTLLIRRIAMSQITFDHSQQVYIRHIFTGNGMQHAIGRKQVTSPCVHDSMKEADKAS